MDLEEFLNELDKNNIEYFFVARNIRPNNASILIVELEKKYYIYSFNDKIWSNEKVKNILKLL